MPKLTNYIDGIYNKDELISYLGILLAILNEASLHKKRFISGPPFRFILQSHNILMILEHDAIRQKWIFYYDTKSSPLRLSIHKIAEKIMAYCSANGWVTFSTKICELDTNHTLVNYVIASTKNQPDIQKIHSFSPFKSKVTDSLNKSWLISAAYTGNNENVWKLLFYGANVNITLSDGYTPLYIAAYKGHLKTVRILLKTEEVKIDPITRNGCTPLFAASQNGHTDIVKILIANNANINLAYKTSLESLRRLAKEHKVEASLENFLKEKNHSNSYISLTPKEIAIIMRHADIVDLLDKQIRVHPNKTKFTLFSNQNKSNAKGQEKGAISPSKNRSSHANRK